MINLFKLQPLFWKQRKYDYDPGTKGFKLKKIMPEGMVFPFDFGFIQGSLGEDGDPLYIIIILAFQAFSGCIMDCRVIDLSRLIKQKKENYTQRRVISIPEASQMFGGVKEIKDLPRDIVNQLETFFIL